MKNKEHLGIGLILISAFGYAMMPILSVGAIKAGTAVPTLLFLRFSIAAAFMWAYIIVKKIPYKTSLKNLLYIGTIGLLGFTVASVSIYTSYKYISSSLATLILFTHPIFVMVLDKIIFKRQTTKRKILAIIITSMGLVLVLYVKEPLNWYGIGLAFISSLTYGAYCLGLSEKNTQKLRGVVVTAYVATTTALATAIQCYISGVPLIMVTPDVLTSAVLLAFVSTIIASITFYEGLSIVGASSATLISSVEPMMVVILSSLFLSEVITTNTLIGGLVIILGIIVLEYKK